MVMYRVEILYETTKGKEGVKKSVIESDSPSNAFDILAEKVSKYKRCMKINGGNCLEIENTCQHKPHEECLICCVCGECSESLDDHDICSNC